MRISGKNQIVIPKNARKKLGLSPGDELLVRAEKELLIMQPKPRSYTQYMQGLQKRVWENVDANSYVEEERQAWSNEPRDLRRRSRTSTKSD